MTPPGPPSPKRQCYALVRGGAGDQRVGDGGLRGDKAGSRLLSPWISADPAYQIPETWQTPDMKSEGGAKSGLQFGF